MKRKAELFLNQGHVMVLDVDIEDFRDYMREQHGIIGFDETANGYGIIHVERWQQNETV